MHYESRHLGVIQHPVLKGRPLDAWCREATCIQPGTERTLC